MSTLNIVMTTIVLLIVGGILAYIFYSRQRTRNLKENYGPEYGRAVEEAGDRRKAEDTLENRKRRIESFQMRDLGPDEQNYFLENWKNVQADFINNPGNGVEEANRLIMEVMLACGYPMVSFDQRVDDLSVNSPEIVPNLRNAHSVAVKNRQANAGTEELRQAMANYKTVLEALLGRETNVETGIRDGYVVDLL